MFLGKSYFSLVYGTFSTEELVSSAAQAGCRELVLANINTTCEAWNFALYCKEAGIQPVIGTEIRNGDLILYTLLAANHQGFTWINEFLSTHFRDKKPFPEGPGDSPFFRDPGDGFVVYPLGGKQPHELHVNERIGIRPWEVNKLFRLRDEGLQPFVAIQPVTVQNRVYYNIHRLLRAIAHNVLLSKLPPEAVCDPREVFTTPRELEDSFQYYPRVLANTKELLDACRIELDFKGPKNKRSFTASVEEDRRLLRQLAYEGRERRYRSYEHSHERVDNELKVIEQMGYCAYFLIAWDLVREAASRGFYHVGRGSGANSVVAYCLRITEVDPIGLNLFFERFLNPERTSPPDFDLDFSWLERDEMIEYVFQKHGAGHVALMGNYTTFKARAVVREFAKVFGLPEAEIAGISTLPFVDQKTYHLYKSLLKKIPQCLQQFDQVVAHYRKKNRLPDYPDIIRRMGRRYGLNREELGCLYSSPLARGITDPVIWDILHYSPFIHKFPHYIGIHSGGILITERPVYEYVALFMPPKGFATAQIDMYSAEKIGLDKLDVLSQRGLGHIRETVRLVRENRGIEIDISEVEQFKQDPRVKKQIREKNTIGCFYIESPAMRSILGKLHCDRYENLVIASSIIRPGVASSGMLREFIERFHGKKWVSLHPQLSELLKDTLEIMVFQEDVIKVAHFFGGLSLGESDILRRAMSGKYKDNNKFALIRERFFTSCTARGYALSLVAEVWRQMESFAGYSFCKAHSASYAVESFQDLYLKAYYPLEFMVGVINNFGGFYPTELYFYQLLKEGARVHLPCVNQSMYLTNIRGREVYAGFTHIRDLRQDSAGKILTGRGKQGPYTSLQDFIERTDIGAAQLDILVGIGALRFTGKSKKELRWESDYLLSKARTHTRGGLFAEKPLSFTLPPLNDDPLDDLYDEKELLGFSLCNPFELADEDPDLYVYAKDMPAHAGKQIKALGYYIAHKEVPTKKENTMAFGTFIDARLDWLDTVHFPDSLIQYSLRQDGFYKLWGRVVPDFNQFSLQVSRIEKVGYKMRQYANL